MRKSYLLLVLFVFIGLASCDLAGNMTPVSKTVAVQAIGKNLGAGNPGYVRYSPDVANGTIGTLFSLDIIADTGITLGCYAINVNYPADLLQVDKTQFISGYESIAMPIDLENFTSYTAVNPNIAGIVRIAAFDVYGAAPQNGEVLLGRIYFKPLTAGTATVSITTSTMTDLMGITIASPLPAGGSATITIQ
jgi:hypothetical protein